MFINLQLQQNNWNKKVAAGKTELKNLGYEIFKKSKIGENLNKNGSIFYLNDPVELFLFQENIKT